ncbi:hypothetical protein HYU50_02355 [Candidatus Woesearchaeota archaeon]|nr:hypothetical protein [Candidatus Woesearchaeota archaeon]
MNNKELEAKRQLFHMFLGTAIVALLIYGLLNKTHIFFLIIIGIIVSFLSKKHKIPVIYWFLKNFDREKDLKSFPGKGVIFYLIGVFLALSFFPLDIAMPAILVLAFGDSVSHLFGVRYGRIKHPFSDKKFIEGMIAGFIAAFIGSLAFLAWHEALIASFFAMLAESIEIKIGAEQVDDNIIIPLVAAIAISFTRFLI